MTDVEYVLVDIGTMNCIRNNRVTEQLDGFVACSSSHCNVVMLFIVLVLDVVV